MTELKITKGDWKWLGRSIVAVTETGNKKIANLVPEYSEEMTANAKLLAASPELLSTLSFIFEKLNTLADDSRPEMFNWYTNGDYKKLKTAIERATV